MLTATKNSRSAPLYDDPEDSWKSPAGQWESVRRQFLQAIDASQAAAVESLLHSAQYSGFGLRAWLNCVAAGGCLPDSIPAELVQVYIHHPAAMPLHDCESCGVAIPVIPNRQYGNEGESDHVFFPECPCCGGRTGWYLYWSGARQVRARPR